MTLEQEIRSLYASTGPVEAEWIIPILLALLCRVEELEAKRGEE